MASSLDFSKIQLMGDCDAYVLLPLGLHSVVLEFSLLSGLGLPVEPLSVAQDASFCRRFMLQVRYFREARAHGSPAYCRKLILGFSAVKRACWFGVSVLRKSSEKQKKYEL